MVRGRVLLTPLFILPKHLLRRSTRSGLYARFRGQNLRNVRSRRTRPSGFLIAKRIRWAALENSEPQTRSSDQQDQSPSNMCGRRVFCYCTVIKGISFHASLCRSFSAISWRSDIVLVGFFQLQAIITYKR